MDASGGLQGKSLVIFGCGYVGAAVAGAARAQGAKVTALTRNAEKAGALRAAGIDVVVGELSHAAWHRRIGAAPDCVLNCVSSGGGTLDDYRRSYVEGMSSVLAWARNVGGVGAIVYTSSTSVYPQGDDALVTEADGHDGVSERGELLLTAERLLCDAAEAGARRFVLRLAGIYGPGRHYLLEQIRSGLVSGLGHHRLNLIHRDDIVGAILACLTSARGEGHAPGAAEIFNVADDHPTPKAEVVAWLAARLGVPEPAFSGEPVGGRRALVPNRRISNARIKAALGWRPTFADFRAGYANVLSD
jgi:nucleoside-diphosphate-sugar epimerase